MSTSRARYSGAPPSGPNDRRGPRSPIQPASTRKKKLFMAKHLNPLEKEFLIRQYRSNQRISIKDFCAINVITGNSLKKWIMTIGDRILLRKRALIETINDELKNMAQIEHSRHRSVVGFTVNLMAGLAAYSFFPKKPMIDVERVSPYENGVIQLSLF